MIALGDSDVCALQCGSKVEFGEDPPVAGLHVAVDLIELLKLLPLALNQCLQHALLPLLDLLELLHLEHLRHLELLVLELGDQVIHLLDLGVLRVEGVEVVGELVRSVAQTGNTDSGVPGNHTLLVVGMSASEMSTLGLADEGVATGPTVGGGVEAVEALGEFVFEDTLEVDVNEVAGEVKDVDRVGEVAEDVGEGLGHLAAHVEVRVLVLQQLDGVLDGAVGGQVLDDLAVDEEEDLHLVLRQVRVLVLVVQLDRRVQQRLPDLLRVVLLAHVDRVVQDLLDLYVRREVLLVVVVTTPQDAVDPQGSDADRLHDVPHAFVKVLHAVIHAVLFAYLEAVLNGEPAVLLEGVHELVGLVLGHEFHEAQDGLL